MAALNQYALSEADQVKLANQLAALDIERVNRVFAKAIQSEKDAQDSSQDDIATPSDSYDITIPWYVMTSGPTRKATEAFFSHNKFFGLDPSQVIFFEQGTLPCLDNDGKVLLDSPSSVAVAPDGNGGLYAALRSPISPETSTTVLSDLAARKIEYIHAYCVDNCLVRVADPVVPKSSPNESVGVVARKSGRFSVVEYSEISKEQAERRDADGQLSFRAGNIANHFYTTAFLNRVAEFEEQMAFHIARKKIPHIDLETGEFRKPSKPNGMKLELFVFDVFPFTESMVVLEVDRKEEFSPLKNAPGTAVTTPDQPSGPLGSAATILGEGWSDSRRWGRNRGQSQG
ncbi:UTP--glucose-1-phosphate uridylyltransferase [Rhizoctonia solani]|uniref:UDP-N-acetylglucosamine diphosphorylase n=1 Tax=Rhizoctonia solani TaxID=456999 RepID=A0A8H7M5V4_9AGAM|nr:UTP--glucose-1-phosphate uridylyltransferase [Rhizoctonia solani]